MTTDKIVLRCKLFHSTECERAHCPCDYADATNNSSVMSVEQD